MYRGVADDAAGRLCAPGLELRLDEHERDPVRYRQPEGRGQHEGCGDERHVAGDELRRERERLEPARVDPLEHDHPLVPAEPRVQLPVADVERDHPRGAALQKTIGETARGRTEIEAVLARRIDAERVERVRELLAAARDELRRAPHLELDVFRDLLAGLGEPCDETGEHERLRLGAALGETALHEHDIQTLLRHDRMMSAGCAPCEDGAVHRTLALPAAVLVAALALVAAGCGGDNASSSEQWADSVCTDLNTWADSVTTTITGVMSKGLGVTKSDLSAAANQTSSATSRLVDDLKAIGPPDTESGQQAQQELQQLGDGIEQHANKAKDLVNGASGSGAAAIVATARSLLVEIGAAADQLKSALTSLEQAGQDIRDGIESSDSCQKLKNRDFASG